MLKKLKILLIALLLSPVAFANTTVCIHENLKTEVIFLQSNIFIHFVGFGQNTYYPVNVSPIVSSSADSVTFVYKNTDTKGISVKIADDSTCSISFYADGQSISYNGMVTVNSIFP